MINNYKSESQPKTPNTYEKHKYYLQNKLLYTMLFINITYDKL